MTSCDSPVRDVPLADGSPSSIRRRNGQWASAVRRPGMAFAVQLGQHGAHDRR
jgi:hypothetical protein